MLPAVVIVYFIAEANGLALLEHPGNQHVALQDTSRATSEQASWKQLGDPKSSMPINTAQTTKQSTARANSLTPYIFENKRSRSDLS